MRPTPLLPAMTALAAITRMLAPAPRRPIPKVTRRRDELIGSRAAGLGQLSTVLADPSPGLRPTIVLGGFIPDSTEQVHLIRGFLRVRGPVYYLNYPRRGFSTDLLCAQLDDLAEELSMRRGLPPVLFSVSFGAGLALEWLRRRRELRAPALSGLVLVSPVACAQDILEDAEAKPTTLLGRALRPYVSGGVEPGIIEKSRTLFTKMFEAGAQNRAALRTLMAPAEAEALRRRVNATIAGVDFNGACERVEALVRMPAPGALDAPLAHCPTLALFSEKEDAVIREGSPTRALFESSIRTVFPHGECRIVRGGATPVQHASLIFHHAQFLAHLRPFYRRLGWGRVRAAA